jgi:hypothetical protein
MSAIETLKDGARWTDHITRAAMPIVLWCAMNGRKIQYGQLQEEMFRRHEIFFEQLGIRKQSVCTKYGYPAGKIGDVIFELADEWAELVPQVDWDVEIPPINAIIVRRDTGLPSDGVEWYLEHYIEDEITDLNRVDATNQVIHDVLNYSKWEKVAHALGYGELEPVGELEDIADIQPIKLPALDFDFSGTGESEDHKKLKVWIAKHPNFFNKFGNYSIGNNEYLLRSGDRVDAFFANNERILAVEAKTRNASNEELSRGVFQCVKYRATLRAMQLVDGRLPNAQAILATQRELTGDLLRAANRLKVAWILVP